MQLIQHIEGYQEDIRELVWLLEELDDERQSCADTLQSLIADIDQDRSETSILFIAGSFEGRISSMVDVTDFRLSRNGGGAASVPVACHSL